MLMIGGEAVYDKELWQEAVKEEFESRWTTNDEVDKSLWTDYKSGARGQEVGIRLGAIRPACMGFKKIFKIDCHGICGAVVEALAILVAVRLWAHIWVTAKARVHVRSDSRAALGALGKVSSPVASINSIAREVALDVATSDYGLEPISGGHVAGVLNDWADALSRLNAPEPKEIPATLAASVKEEGVAAGGARAGQVEMTSMKEICSRVRAGCCGAARKSVRAFGQVAVGPLALLLRHGPPLSRCIA